MEKNNLSIFLNNSNYSKENYAFNENENEINISKKYLNIELKQEENNTLKNEEKYKIYENSHKNKIFEKNYGQKISLSNQLNLGTINKSKSKNNSLENIDNDLSIGEYINELKKKYAENNIFSEDMNININKYYYLFSFCPLCHNLAFAYRDIISCVNKCFMLKIQTSEFNDKYTLDIFLKSYYDFCKYHLKCNGEVIPIYIDDNTKKPFFICTSCDNDIFEKNGIIL